MVANKNRSVADKMEKKFSSALKKSTQEKNTLPVIIRNGVKVKMPIELVLMRAAFSKIQLNIIVTVLKTIGNKVDEIINKKLKEGDIMSLFPKEEFGEDENSIQFVIKRKEFGIPASHIEELKGALRLMRMVPVDLPLTGKVTGISYTKYTNLCSVTLPNDDLKDYCIVEMRRDVAHHILHEDLRYATIVDSISRKLRSKYSIRIYWMVMLYAYNGGVTFNFEEFKKQVCGTENKYDRYPRFEDEVLRKAKKDIDDLYEQGLSEYCFEYHPTKEDREESKEKGNPETIIFTINKVQTPLLDEKLNINESVFSKRVKEIENTLVDDLNIIRSRALKMTKMVTEENIDAFIGKIEKLKEIKASDPSKSGGFFATSVLNFFDEFRPVEVLQQPEQDTEELLFDESSEKAETIKMGEAKPEVHDQKYWRVKWYECQEELKKIALNIDDPLKNSNEAFRSIIQCMIYDKFDEASNNVVIVVPTLFMREFIEKNLGKLLQDIINRHYGNGVSFDIVYRGFQGKLLSDKAELVQKYSFTCDFFEQMEYERKKAEEERRAFEEKCYKAWSTTFKAILHNLKTDEEKTFFKENISFEKYDDLLRVLTLRIPDRDVYNTLEWNHTKLMSWAIEHFFGKNITLQYIITGKE